MFLRDDFEACKNKGTEENWLSNLNLWRSIRMVHNHDLLGMYLHFFGLFSRNPNFTQNCIKQENCIEVDFYQRRYLMVSDPKF